MKQNNIDSSPNKLSIEALTTQNWPRGIDASFIFVVLSFYGESLRGRGFVTVLTTSTVG